jgi:hypothetical protein
MASLVATPDSVPIVISSSPVSQPAPKDNDRIDAEVKQTLFDIKKYKWELIAIVVVLVVFLLAWWFWGRKNNNTNAVRIGGGKIAKRFSGN